MKRAGPNGAGFFIFACPRSASGSA
jgi:hypothetical protein